MKEKTEKNKRGKGRPRCIKEPADLWQHFLDYVKDVKASPFLVHDFVGKDAHEVRREREKPLSMAGFERFVFENQELDFLGVEQYFTNPDNRYKDFIGICSRIKKYIRADQIEGGSAGIYNASITQRLNGLHETIKQEDNKPQKITVNVVKAKHKKDETNIPRGGTNSPAE